MKHIRSDGGGSWRPSYADRKLSLNASGENTHRSHLKAAQQRKQARRRGGTETRLLAASRKL